MQFPFRPTSARLQGALRSLASPGRGRGAVDPSALPLCCLGADGKQVCFPVNQGTLVLLFSCGQGPRVQGQRHRS